MSNIVPQPQITFENNKIYVDSPVDVKYTLDGLDPVFYGVIYTSPISISHTTTIKAISVNSLGEISNLVAGTFTPESDVSDGSSGSTWNPSYDDAVTLEELSAMSYVTSYALENASYATTTYVADYVAEHGSGEMPDLSSYVTKDELSAQSYITINDVPETDLSDYVTYDFLSSQSYLTSIPSEYITQQELSSNSYLTQHQDLRTYIASPSSLTYNGQISLFPNGIQINQYGQIHAGWYNYNQIKDQNYHWMSSGTTRNLIHGILAYSSYLTSVPSEYITQTELSSCGYITASDIDLSGYFSVNGGDIYGKTWFSDDAYLARQTENGPSYLWIGSNRPWKIWENNQEPTVTANVGNKILRFSGYNTTTGTLYRVFSINENSTTADSTIYAHSPITHENVTYHKGITYDLNTVFTYNVLPYENATYMLGDAGHIYRYAYIQTLRGLGTGFSLLLGTDPKYDFYGSSFRPRTNGNIDLGGDQYKWAYTYTNYLILDGTDINDKFIPTEGGTVTGRLESNYYTTVNSEGGISSYSSVLVGADDRNSVTMLATRRLCGETSYAAAFFTNSDGRSKFTHKTKTTATTALGSNDDAFLCFNAYGFKLAYSGTPGTSATTEYEVLHMGNIGNLFSFDSSTNTLTITTT